MSIGKLRRIFLKTLSYPANIDLSKSYLLERDLTRVRHLPLLKPFYTMWDKELLIDGHTIPVRVFYPPKKQLMPSVLIYFHGGGWVSGDIDSYTNTCAYLSKYTKRIVICVDYRLAPEHPFPAALNDCYAVCREVFTNLQHFHTTNIVIMGDSAGGNLAAAVSLKARDTKEFKIPKQILIYPATYNDHSASSPYASIRENGTDYVLTAKRICEYMDFYSNSPNDKTSCYFAPLLTKDFSGLPQTLVLTAQYDPLRDEGEDFARKLKAGGTYAKAYRIPDTLHGFFTKNPAYKPVRESYAIINYFLGRSEENEQTKKYEVD